MRARLIIRIVRLFHRVRTAAAAGVAAQNPPQCHGHTPNKPVLLDGFTAIFRAAGLVLTVTIGEECFDNAVVRRKGFLVDPDQEQERFSGELFEGFPHRKGLGLGKSIRWNGEIKTIMVQL